MGILGKIIKTIAVKHAKNFSANVNTYDPCLKKAVINKIEKKIANLFSSTQVGGFNVNHELEAMENIVFDWMGLGLFDNILDILKYVYYAVKIGKFKFNEVLVIYRQELVNNISQQIPRIDLRKGNITAEEIDSVMKKIFIA